MRWAGHNVRMEYLAVLLAKRRRLSHLGIIYLAVTWIFRSLTIDPSTYILHRRVSDVDF